MGLDHVTPGRLIIFTFAAQSRDDLMHEGGAESKSCFSFRKTTHHAHVKAHFARNSWRKRPFFPERQWRRCFKKAWRLICSPWRSHNFPDPLQGQERFASCLGLIAHTFPRELFRPWIWIAEWYRYRWFQTKKGYANTLTRDEPLQICLAQSRQISKHQFLYNIQNILPTWS